MTFDLARLPRGEIVAALFPGQAIDLDVDDWVSVRCVWPGCGPRHKSGEDRNPSAILNPTRGVFKCKVSDAQASGWKELVQQLLGDAAWDRYREACFTEPRRGAPPALEDLWRGLEQEHVWTDLYRIEPELRARYLRAGRRRTGEVFSDSVLGLFDDQGAIAGVKFRLPRGKRWAHPPKGGHPEDKYLAAPGSKLAGVVFLADLARARPEATVVVCAGEKDALVAASHLDAARWAPVSGCVGECPAELPRSWRDAITAVARGRHVVIAYDGDAPGHHGAWRLARALEGAATSVRAAVMPTPDELAPPAGEDRWDVAAYVLERGGAALEQLLAAAAPVPSSWEPPPPPPGRSQQARAAAAGGGAGGGAPASSSTARASSPRQRPRIVVTTAIRDMTTEAEAAIAASSHGVYQRGGLLVRVVHVDDHARVVELPEPTLLELTSDAAEWVRLKEIDGELEEVPAVPPRDVVRALARRAEWIFPPLDSVVHGPVLRPDGTVLDVPGYDRGSRLLYEPRAGVTWPRVLEQPTKADATAALGRLRALVDEFPFVAQSDRSAWLALVLTLVARPAIDGPVPLFLVRATAPGTGKSLLIDVAALIGTDVAGEPARMAQSRDRSGEEETKRILALGLQGAPLAMIDNIEEPLGSDVLAMALTTRVFTGRRLGTNDMVDVRLPVFVATGNSVVVKGDLGRRVVPIDLDAGMEHPEQRTGFRYPNLVAHVRAHRAELRAAALTVLRWHCVAGKPAAPLAPFGSYEAWSALVPAALVWLGETDPGAGRRRIEESGDPEAEARKAALEGWWDKWGPQERTALEVASSAGEELRVALAGLGHGLQPERLDVRKLGYALRRIAGRVVSGMRLEGTRKAGVARWRVVRLRPVGEELGGGAGGAEQGEAERESAAQEIAALEAERAAQARPAEGDLFVDDPDVWTPGRE